MIKKINFQSQWTIGIVCSLIPIVIPTIYSVFVGILSNEPFLSTFWETLESIFCFKISLWVILLALLLLAVVYLLVKRYKSPPNYTEEDFGKLHLWRWDWEKRKGKWEIINLQPYCSNCDTLMIQDKDLDDGTEHFYCANCEVWYVYYNPEIIKAKIFDNIKKGKIKKIV